jgi:hypothetical protein
MLPSNSYQSGVRAGTSKTKVKAMEALRELLETHCVEIPVERQNEIITRFREKLGAL